MRLRIEARLEPGEGLDQLTKLMDGLIALYAALSLTGCVVTVRHPDGEEEEPHGQ